MTARPLFPQQPVTQKGDLPSQDLVEIIQRLVTEVEAQKARIEALEALHP